MVDVALLPYPNTPEPAVAGLRVTIERTGTQLRLRYQLAGELAVLSLEDFTHLRRVDGLWEHTCFELFVRSPGSAAYCELNFAPSGAWAAYHFSDYRRGMEPIAALQPTVRVRREHSVLALEAALPLADLDPAYTSGALQLAASAVIENCAAQRSYWAARHPIGKPDFHHADAFVIALTPPEH